MSPAAPPDPHELFGDTAVRLGARSRCADRLPGFADPRTVDVVCRNEALDPSLRPVLEARGYSVLAEDGSLRLRGPLVALQALAGESKEVACLLAVHTAARAPLAQPRLMGIVNVTPDSFSDGGEFLDPRRAVEHGLELVADGADLLDVGGESTRPGSDGVNETEELARVVPVVAGLRAHTEVPISVDTQKAAVARAALDAGATMVNDVSAGRHDPKLLEVVAEYGCDLCLMHMRGRPRDMQVDPSYADVVAEVVDHLRERVAACLKTGIALPKIVLDPGIGFGKRLADNLALVRATSELRSLGRPILLGVSRKSFLGLLSGTEPAHERLPETTAANTAGILFGAEILRVHDVRSMVPALRVAAALAGIEPLPSP